MATRTELRRVAARPVENVSDEQQPEEGVALALSGGGYRAMLFHLGFLWRLRDAGVLNGVKRISSVSGGSITSGALALAWARMDWSDSGESFRRLVADPILRLARETIDIPSGLLGRVPGLSGGWIKSRYDQRLFRGATLQDLPDEPRFVFNATSLHSGKLFRFSKPFLAEWSMGRWWDPVTRLAEAVAASSAFPPVLSPVTIDVSGLRFDSEGGVGRPPLDRISLTDGGVYDNLGLETVWKRYRGILISDGGAGFDYQERPSALLWKQALRVTSMLQEQIGMLRQRQMIAGFDADANSPLKRSGFLSSIGRPMAKGRPVGALAFRLNVVRALANEPTRLKRLPFDLIKQLVNWGYVSADDRMRSRPEFVTVAPPDAPPFPEAPL